MKLGVLAVAAAALAFASAGTAQAADLNFNYSGGDGTSFNFVLDSMPTPNAYTSGTDTHFIVSGIENGVTQTFGIDFFSAAAGGGLETDDNTINVYGQIPGGIGLAQQIYSGTENTPFFTPGIYFFQSNTDAAVPRLDITEVRGVSAAPEASIWALMFGGVGLLGGMLRVAQARRREDEAVTAAAT